MGTSASIRVMENGQAICAFYVCMDGYPDGIGKDIYDVIGKSKLINGIGAGHSCPDYFNGMGCLAAYLVGELKGGYIGNLYMISSEDWGRESYNYTIKKAKGSNKIKCTYCDGTWSKLKNDGDGKEHDLMKLYDKKKKKKRK